MIPGNKQVVLVWMVLGKMLVEVKALDILGQLTPGNILVEKEMLTWDMLDKMLMVEVVWDILDR